MSMLTGTGLLDWHASTEWTCTRRVLTADHADVCLACDGSGALHVGRKGGLEWDIGSTSVRSAVVTWDLLGDVDWLPVGALASDIDHAFVWTSTITVDLVDGHSKLATSRDLWESAAIQLKNLLGAGFNVVVTTLCCP